MDIKLHTEKARELSGRDTIARYTAQFKAAAIAALEILKNDSVVAIYCDFHDDFVIERKLGDKSLYEFVQVKTNKQKGTLWSQNDLIAYSSSTKNLDNKKVRNSFLGKLLIHTITFKDNCKSVVFLTNIDIKESDYPFKIAVNERDFENADLKKLINKFCDVFEITPEISYDQILTNISKLQIETSVPYINLESDSFKPIAKEKICDISEIDLTNSESENIVISLLSLIYDKSMKKIDGNLTEDSLKNIAGVTLDDLLDVMCLSKIAYYALVEGNDPFALKTTSILKKICEKNDWETEDYELAARLKSKWDSWNTEKRHTESDWNMNKIKNKLSGFVSSLRFQKLVFEDLFEQIEAFHGELSNWDNPPQITLEELLGGVFSTIVRNES